MDPAPSRAAPAVPPALPLVVQVGFAGSRQLLPEGRVPAGGLAAYERGVEEWLADRLGRLRAELGLTAQHFLCGLSQVAAGGDQVFGRVLARLALPQRVLLPQPRDGYLGASDAEGRPDFTREQRAEAERLLASPHVIQERVASDAAERHARFEDVNLELARVSDVVLLLVRADAPERAGGSADLRLRARARGRPVLEVRVAPDDAGRPTFDERWHGREDFEPPALPRDLASLPRLEAAAVGPPPPAAVVVDHLKRATSAEAVRRRTRYVRGAVAIVLAHIVATAMAASALAQHVAAGAGDGAHHPAAVPWLLGLELLLLASGFAVHHALHGSHVARSWAFFRLVAEVARSVGSIGPNHVYLRHLFGVALPRALRPLLRTLNVLHLRDTCRGSCPPWRGPGQRRAVYLRRRFSGPEGQLRFYGARRDSARRWLAWAHRTFRWLWIGAVLATSLELLSACDACPVEGLRHDPVQRTLSVLAILLPMLAVGALSLAAVLDFDANAHVYAEMRETLLAQRRNLKAATSEREFVRLLLETEARLLGESASWFARRYFTNVT